MVNYTLNNEQKKLVEDNMGLAYDRANKMYNKYKRYNDNLCVEKDDYIAGAMLGLCCAARLYNPDKNIKFSTYAVPCIDRRIRDSVFNNSIVNIPSWDALDNYDNNDELWNMAYNVNITSFDEENIDDNDLYNLLGVEDENLLNMELISDIKNVLKENEYELMIDKYVNGFTSKELSIKYGYSDSYINKKIKRIINKLRKKLKYT